MTMEVTNLKNGEHFTTEVANTTGIRPITRLVLPGWVRVGKLLRPLFVRIVHGNPSYGCGLYDMRISGVLFPRKGGGCESCGQIPDELDNISVFNHKEGWDKERVVALREYWKRYHLFSMNSRCEHQEQWDAEVYVDHYSYERGAVYERWTSEVLFGECEDYEEYLEKTELLKAAAKTSIEYVGPPTELIKTLMYKELLTYTGPRRVPASQVWASAHPEGYIGKRCEVCGHAYGTFLGRPVPSEVLDYFEAYQNTAHNCPWPSMKDGL